MKVDSPTMKYLAQPTVHRVRKPTTTFHIYFLIYESPSSWLAPHGQLTLVPPECDRLQLSVCLDTFPTSPGVSLRWPDSLTVVSVITSTPTTIWSRSLTNQIG